MSKKTEPKIKYIDNTAALKRAAKVFPKISRPTMITWCIQHDIGIKVAGRWRVDLDKLDKLLTGELQDGPEKE